MISISKFNWQLLTKFNNVEIYYFQSRADIENFWNEIDDGNKQLEEDEAIEQNLSFEESQVG